MVGKPLFPLRNEHAANKNHKTWLSCSFLAFFAFTFSLKVWSFLFFSFLFFLKVWTLVTYWRLLMFFFLFLQIKKYIYIFILSSFVFFFLVDRLGWGVCVIISSLNPFGEDEIQKLKSGILQIAASPPKCSSFFIPREHPAFFWPRRELLYHKAGEGRFANHWGSWEVTRGCRSSCYCQTRLRSSDWAWLSELLADELIVST